MPIESLPGSNNENMEPSNMHMVDIDLSNPMGGEEGVEAGAVGHASEELEGDCVQNLFPGTCTSHFILLHLCKKEYTYAHTTHFISSYLHSYSTKNEENLEDDWVMV